MNVTRRIGGPFYLFRAYGASLIVFFVLILLSSTFFAWYYTKKSISRQAYIKFEKAVEETKLLIKDRVELYIQTLYGVQSLFAASKTVDRDEWAAYLRKQNIRERYPGIVAVRFIERVAAKDKTAFTESVKNDKSLVPSGYPDFQIYPPGERDEYCVIKYVEPFEGNEKMFGSDILTDQERSKFLKETRDTGDVTMTGRVKLMTGQENQVGVIIVLPIYKNNMPVSTMEERRAAHEGFADAVFRADDLLSGVFGKKVVHPEIGFQVYDGETLSPENLLYDDESVLRVIYPDFKPRFSVASTLKIGGRTWTLRFTALPEFGLNETEEKLPLVVLSVGIIFSFLLFGILYSFATSRIQAVLLAEGMTAKLRESEHRYADLVEGAPDPIITLDRLGHLKSMNPASERVSGYRANEMLGKYFARTGVLVPSSMPRTLQEFALAILGRERSPFEIEIFTKDKRKLTLEANPRPIKQEGKTVEVQIIFRDITDRKHTENVLREFTNYLDKIINSVADPIFVKNRKHRWVLVNEAYCHFVGYKREELIGKSDYDFFPKEEADVFLEKDEFVFETGRETLNEEKYTDAHGVTHITLTKKTLYVDTKGEKFIVGIVRDITELKKTEEMIRDLNENLKRRNFELLTANGELESFSYSVSHDLRAPLRAISGFANALLEDCADNLSPEGRRYLTLIRTNAKSMGKLIDDLLAFSRLGRKEIDLSDVSVNDLVKDVFKDIKLSIPERAVELKVSQLSNAHADSAMIRQVFMNLISNAVKFTAPQKKAVIEVGSKEGDKETVYYVKDNGVGFDIRYVGKLFGVFQRLHGVEEFEGTGVGLAIVKRIIHRHGGRVWAEGKPNEGAVFYFTLPKSQNTQGSQPIL